MDSGALGSGLAIFTRFPLISAQALPYSLSGSPAQAIAGDFFVKKAAGNVVILHPLLGEVEIWTNHVRSPGPLELCRANDRCTQRVNIRQILDKHTGLLRVGNWPMLYEEEPPRGDIYSA